MVAMVLETKVMISPFAHGFFREKRLLVAGAGYVGGAVSRQFFAKGGTVVVLTRNAQKEEVLRKVGMEALVADLAEDKWHTKLDGSFDFVLNCVSSGGGGLTGYQHSYLEGCVP
ncbi:MAG: hypothetical protein J6386_05535 [Candidatus Synoicihabitans palmerolidicus]|nr:hypothetical protein [Candidatus Synoicihabitans palmerolidicus]